MAEIVTRRSFLRVLTGIIAAPAVIHVASLRPLRGEALILPQPVTLEVHGVLTWSEVEDQFGRRVFAQATPQAIVWSRPRTANGDGTIRSCGVAVDRNGEPSLRGLRMERVRPSWRAQALRAESRNPKILGGRSTHV